MSEPPFEPVSEAGTRVVAAAKRAYLAEGPSARAQAAMRARIEAHARERARRWKLGVGLAVLLGLGASYAGVSMGPRTAPPAAQPPAAQPPAVVPHPAPAALPSAELPPAPLPPPSSPEAAAARPVKKRAAARAAAPADPLSELALLTRARAALGSVPRTTLALCDEHRRSHPRGVLREERELLAVEALAALGERSALARRTDAFERAFPGSLHLTRVRALRAASENPR